jgi:RimJ/RimL family protein N-acetyltransferase
LNKNDCLCLKGLEPTDLPDRQRWLNDPDTTRYFTNLGATPLTQEALRQWYEKLASAAHKELHFSVYTLTGQHIGGAQLKNLDWKNRSTELGLFIGEKDYRGQGLGQQITRLLLNYGFSTLNLYRLWLRVDAANMAALRFYEKCGLQREGIFRAEVFRNGGYHDSIVMSILEPEWREKTISCR